MDTNEILKDTAAANASAVDSLIADLTAAITRLQAARAAFASATTWTEFDNAVVDVKGAVAHLPKHRDEAMQDYNVVTDPL